jgi:hypothetical protein
MQSDKSLEGYIDVLCCPADFRWHMCGTANADQRKDKGENYADWSHVTALSPRLEWRYLTLTVAPWTGSPDLESMTETKTCLDGGMFFSGKAQPDVTMQNVSDRANVVSNFIRRQAQLPNSATDAGSTGSAATPKVFGASQFSRTVRLPSGAAACWRFIGVRCSV